MVNLNLDSLSIDSNGRVSFSGLGTGIDLQGAVDGIIAAKRIPAVTLEARITGNETKITALNELRNALSALKSSITGLRGAISFDDSNDSFASKQAFASTSRIDGATPSVAGNLFGVSVENSASAGSHELEILRVATANKIASATFSSISSALGFADNITIGGENGATTISIQATDSLADVRDRINTANTGTNATDVTASIVSVSSTQHILVLTNDKLGSTLNISDSGTLLSDLGFSSTNGVASISNGLASGSKIESGDGFSLLNLANGEGDSAFLVSYDSSTEVLTLTRGDGTSDAVALSSATIATGETETASFQKFGVSIVLDENFDKTTDITVDADVSSITGGTGVIDDSTISITGSSGDISGITTETLTFGTLGVPSTISVTVDGFTGSFDGTTTGTKSVTLSDGTNTLDIEFDVTTVFSGLEVTGSITLNEMQNLAVSSGSYTTELQKGETARLTVDGLTDSTHHESARVASSTAELSTFLSDATFPGSFTINGTGSAVINYAASDTLDDLATSINNELGTTGVTATVVTDGSGFRLNLDASSGFTLTDTNGLLADLSVDDALVVERTSNTVSDVFTGVSLSLFAAEQGTTIKVEIERDLTSVKSEIETFIESYNEVRRLLNSHSKLDDSTGLAAEDAGELFGMAIVTEIKSRLAEIAGNNVSGVTNDFAGLASIGITLVDNDSLNDPLDVNTLQIDSSTLDEALINNIDDVRRLLAFDFTSSNPNAVLLGFSGNTTHATSGYTLNVGTMGNLHSKSDGIDDQTATLDDANSYGAATSGSFTINGETITYDVTTDTLNSLVGTINNAMVGAGTGVIASLGFDENGKISLKLDSSTSTISTADVSGDLFALINFQADTSRLDSANIGGASDGSDDGTVTVAGRTITVTDQSGAEDLRVLYNGTGSESAIEIDFTVGLTAALSELIDNFVDSSSGSIQAEIASFEGQNIVAQERIEQLDGRLIILRESLLRRFVAMETAVTSMNQTLDAVRQQFAALTGNTN